MIPLDTLLGWLDHAGVAVFAASGALVAARKQMDVVGFIVIVIGAAAGFGGGTVRDLLLGRTPVFWLRDPALLAVVSAVAVLIFFAGPRLRRGQAALLAALLWADAVGLSLFAVLGGGDRPDRRHGALGGGAARHDHRLLRRGAA
jgi:uncharacterized membrane protein YeiH